MFRKSLFLTLVLCGYINAQTLTLKESLRLGLENSKEIKIANAQAEIANYQTRKILSAFFPAFAFSASYARLSEVPPFEISTPLFPRPLKIQDAILNNYSLRLGFNVPIFVGFKLSSLLKSAKLKAEAAKEEASLSKNEKAFRIITAFWNLRKAELAEKALGKNIESLTRHVKDAKNSFLNGLATKADLLKIETQLADVKLKYREASNRVRLARMFLNQEIGLPLESKTEIKTDSLHVELPMKLSEELIRNALQNRLELKKLKLLLASGRENITAAKSDWFPSISLFGNYYYNRPNQRILPLKDEFKDTWDVGIGLTWTLWDWGKRSATTEEAVKNLEVLRLKTRIVEENIRTEITADYLELENSREKIKSAKTALEFAKENLRVTEELYKQSKARLADLLDAESSQLSALMRYHTALMDFQINKAKFLKSLGRSLYENVFD